MSEGIVSGTDKVLAMLKKATDSVTKAVPSYMDRLVADEAELVQERYDEAKYDGTSDITVISSKSGDGAWNIEASGTTLLFIEYGTGIIFPHNPGLADGANYPAGSWSTGPMGKGWLTGNKLKKYHGWWRLPGSNGERSGIFTAGNPSANVMYEETKRVAEEFPKYITYEIQRANRY